MTAESLKRKRDDDSDASEDIMPARKVPVLEAVKNKVGTSSALAPDEGDVPSANSDRPKAVARSRRTLAEPNMPVPIKLPASMATGASTKRKRDTDGADGPIDPLPTKKLRPSAESTASRTPFVIASIQQLPPPSPSSASSRTSRSSLSPSSATEPPSPVSSTTSLSSEVQLSPEPGRPVSFSPSTTGGVLAKPIPAISTPAITDSPAKGALPVAEASASGQRDKKALSSTKPFVANGRGVDSQLNPDSPAQAHSRPLSETSDLDLIGGPIANSSSTAHLSSAQLAADALAVMTTWSSTDGPREASDGKCNGTSARGGKSGKVTTTSKCTPAKITATAPAPSGIPVSGGDDGSDPPKPPQTPKRTTPEDKADITLDNAKDFDKKGAFVVQYYADPMTFEEHNEYQNAAIELKKRGNVTLYQSNKAWIPGEIRTRGLDPDMSPKRRQHVLKLYHLSESDLMVRPRGVVVSST
ncbi:uncharacterized protein AB675_6663 [Cyphellophora attinorum]|uniref:Uncharacterized protein n=1 Tax=Cyphellophora attinorum TaxID=1664694 RepID=A0A0N0NPV6_9EURO|nr:uncharacterized protein AB675_6663 [Phialophora attinorum]KPI43201.1 hypothetical protein AB675_6663 [Phialophora attinorum]